MHNEVLLKTCLGRTETDPCSLVLIQWTSFYASHIFHTVGMCFDFIAFCLILHSVQYQDSTIYVLHWLSSQWKRAHLISPDSFQSIHCGSFKNVVIACFLALLLLDRVSNLKRKSFCWNDETFFIPSCIKSVRLKLTECASHWQELLWLSCSIVKKNSAENQLRRKTKALVNGFLRQLFFLLTICCWAVVWCKM